MVLDFLNGTYPFIFIPIGIIAVALGVDRALKKEEEESRTLKILGGIAGIILLALTIILALNEFNEPGGVISNYTILFSIFMALSLIARPFKNVHIAFIVSVFVALGLLTVIIFVRESSVSLAGIPLQYILIAVMVIVLLVYIISFIQEQAIDAFLAVLGWGPVITILGLLIIVQAITLLLDYPNSDGLLSYLPG